jgi:hypothetical protein
VPEATEGPTVLRILLGTQLRRLRGSPRYLLTMERLSIVARKPDRAPGILTALIGELEEEL